jgi:hypothetical protein
MVLTPVNDFLVQILFFMDYHAEPLPTDHIQQLVRNFPVCQQSKSWLSLFL